jgi:hypothetical protein
MPSGFLLNFKDRIFYMLHSTSSNLKLIGISQKVWHKILYAIGRTVAVEQLARQKSGTGPTQKKKNGKKTGKGL